MTTAAAPATTSGDATVATAAAAPTAFITDVEGNGGYFWRCVEASPLLARELREGMDADGYDAHDVVFAGPAAAAARLVYGGDACDKGCDDLAVAAVLLRMRARYGAERVGFILGNRDVNKLRLPSEAACPARAEHPHWMPLPLVPYERWCAEEGVAEPDAVAKVQWMLRHTMGAPRAFGFRADELARRRKAAAAAATTAAEVAEDFVAGVLAEDGVLRRYIEAAELARREGDTLYVHGGLTRENVGFVPGKEVCVASLVALGEAEGVPGTRHACLDDWVAALRRFKDGCLEDWVRNPYFAEAEAAGAPATRAGDALITYGYSRLMRRHTVMTVSFLNRGRPSPDILCDDVLGYLRAAGIKRVVTGHQPYGDSPGVIRKGGVVVVFADTSFSDPTAPDCRGAAAASVVLEEDDTRISGTLADGTRYSFALSEAPLVGRAVRHEGEEWWCAALLDSVGTHYLRRTCEKDSHKLEHKRVHESEIEPVAMEG
eukprot:Rhum_TRINITY_DN10961_c0_g1::Rhum_TRINITY_DN10961_c0_g1_i1::g.41254::m.41254